MIGRISFFNDKNASGVISAEGGAALDFDVSEVLEYDVSGLATGQLVHFDLARTYLEAKASTEAYAEFDTCIKRRGEATAVFLDDVPSYRYFPPVYYYLGLTQDALKSPAAAQSFNTLLSIKEKGAGDPLAENARKRLAPAK